MTATNIYVDTIHLNIGVGDCSIVCKYQPTTNGAPILLSAVIIDGGFQSSAGVIKKCIQTQLDASKGGLYDLRQTGGSVKFDSIVITHWDRDHWGGLINLIRDDLNGQLGTLSAAAVAAAQKEAEQNGQTLTKPQLAAIEATISMSFLL